MEQTRKIAENVKNGNIQVSEEVKESFLPQFERSEEETKALLAENSPNDEVAVWPVVSAIRSVSIYCNWRLRKLNGNKSFKNIGRPLMKRRSLKLLP